MKLIVGLGNPGKEYAGTRHNIGFDVVNALAAQLGWNRSPDDFDRVAKARFEGIACDGLFGSEKLFLLKPLTYMNLSGRSVLAAMQFYQLSPADLLVILDDLALPVGQIRLRGEGSSGGHNGLKDIEKVLSTPAYPRLRIGIDPVPPRIPQKDYVLQRFPKEQADKVAITVKRACECIEAWVTKGIAPAMSQFNVKESVPTNKPKPVAPTGGSKDSTFSDKAISPDVPGKNTQR